jgi:type IV pilus assembly protein PilN
MVATALILITLLLLVNNAQTAIAYFSNTEETRNEIAKIEKETEAETRREQAVRARIARVNQKALNNQVAFINTQIEERAFSWSALLDDLEQVMPADVRLMSLNPSVSRDGEITLALVCASKQSDGLVRLINNLFANPNFDRPTPQQEATEEGLHRFAVSVSYDPAGARTPRTVRR